MPSRSPLQPPRWSAARAICPSPREARLLDIADSCRTASASGLDSAHDTSLDAGLPAWPRTTISRYAARGATSAEAQTRPADQNCLVDPAWPRTKRISDGLRDRLVRLGLREANDPSVVDTRGRRSTAQGGNRPVRTIIGTGHNGDGYGEHWMARSLRRRRSVGRAFGRCLLESAAIWRSSGRDPLPCLDRWRRSTGPAGMIPEQIWDAAALPDRNLWPGKPTGSAMPLVWAHAEFIKLAASRQLKRPFDRPEAVWQRYSGKRPTPDFALWMPRVPVDEIDAGTRCASACPSPPGCTGASTAGSGSPTPKRLISGWACTWPTSRPRHWPQESVSTSRSSGQAIVALGGARLRGADSAARDRRGTADRSRPARCMSFAAPVDRRAINRGTSPAAAGRR